MTAPIQRPLRDSALYIAPRKNVSSIRPTAKPATSALGMAARMPDRDAEYSGRTMRTPSAINATHTAAIRATPIAKPAPMLVNSTRGAAPYPKAARLVSPSRLNMNQVPTRNAPMARRLNTRCRGNSRIVAASPCCTRGLTAAATTSEAAIKSTKSVNEPAAERLPVTACDRIESAPAWGNGCIPGG